MGQNLWGQAKESTPQALQVIHLLTKARDSAQETKRKGGFFIEIMKAPEKI